MRGRLSRRRSWPNAGPARCGRLPVGTEAQPGLVHERRSLERMPVGLAGHFRTGQLAQLVINKRQQLLGGLRITLSRAVQDYGNLVHEALGNTGGTGNEARILRVFKYTAGLALSRPPTRNAIA